MWCPGVCPSAVSAVNARQVIYPRPSLKGRHRPVMWCAPLWSRAGYYGKYKPAIGLGEKAEGSVLCKGPGSF